MLARLCSVAPGDRANHQDTTLRTRRSNPVVRAHPPFQEPSLDARPTRLTTAYGEQIADEERLNDHIDILQLDNSLQRRATSARDGTRAAVPETLQQATHSSPR